MRKYIVLFAFLVILKTSWCSNERLETIINGYGQLIEAKEQELILLEMQISDLQKKLDEIKTNSVNILELDQLRKNLMEKEEQLMVCESNAKNQSAPGFWSTVKEIIKPKLEEKLKFLSANNVEANAKTMSKQEEANESSTWDWKDIPRQIVLYYSGN
ncbi:autophagy-related protein 25 [Drosophila santomea]|uniref:autophagy-related protein 25 n=1 Tax=Drosophila santomea TaxID=129105 RepID=UPI001954E9E7|nr:autophagy-related protein 25 [Drosophila santomea]